MTAKKRLLLFAPTKFGEGKISFVNECKSNIINTQLIILPCSWPDIQYFQLLPRMSMIANESGSIVFPHPHFVRTIRILFSTNCKSSLICITVDAAVYNIFPAFVWQWTNEICFATYVSTIFALTKINNKHTHPTVHASVDGSDVETCKLQCVCARLYDALFRRLHVVYAWRHLWANSSAITKLFFEASTSDYIINEIIRVKLFACTNLRFRSVSNACGFPNAIGPVRR